MPMEPNVAVLVDCENAQPAVLDHAMRHAATLGRVVLRRAYGNAASLTHKWQDGLIRHNVAPCLQFQYVGGKNTADLALALDALEMLLDRRAEQFVIVTSDSDFVGLCRKLQDRGARVDVFGEVKTPGALRCACDRFHESVAPMARVDESACAAPVAKPDPAMAVVKRRPRFVVDAVRMLMLSSSNGTVDLGALGNHLRELHADFSHTTYGYKSLRMMVAAYDLLHLHQSEAGPCRVSLAPDVAPPAILRAV